MKIPATEALCVEIYKWKDDWGYVGIMGLGLREFCRDNGKENGNYFGP